MDTLLNRLGGEDAIAAAVHLFYTKVLDDKRINIFFENLDMATQINKQIAFMTMAFGGKTRFTGKDLAQAHAPLVKRGLRDEHFDAIVQCLESSLLELKIERSLIDEVKVVIEKTRDSVFGRKSAS